MEYISILDSINKNIVRKHAFDHIPNLQTEKKNNLVILKRRNGKKTKKLTIDIVKSRKHPIFEKGNSR